MRHYTYESESTVACPCSAILALVFPLVFGLEIIERPSFLSLTGPYRAKFEEIIRIYHQLKLMSRDRSMPLMGVRQRACCLPA